MSALARDFYRSHCDQPHHDRASSILKRHPKVRALIGPEPMSALVIALAVPLQLGLAYLMRRAPLYVTIFIAYTLGALLSKGLWVMIHECAHNLVFRSRLANEIAGAFANLPHVLPMSALFRQVHLRHHAHIGEYALDGDLPSRWEAALTSAGFGGKALWLLFFPLCSGTRIFRVGVLVDAVAVATVVGQTLFDVAVVSVAGWGALLYLTLSFFFSVGLHPLGARWVQEHHIVQEAQETYSYYGVLNRLCFNIGYHTEHHDIASIPWNRLPRLRAMAADFYDHRAAHSSWLRILLRFLFDRNDCLYRRMIRENGPSERRIV